MERDLTRYYILFVRSDFNSHAHVERDGIATIITALTAISTHTLTWSVTKILIHHSNSPTISTHTLTWSVTYLKLGTMSSSAYFNSHAHVERDALKGTW